MKRMALIFCSVALACGILAGCTVDQYARMLIEQDTTYGRINEAMVGSSAQLVKNKTISAARQITMPDKTVIDVWVIKASAKAAGRGTVLLLHGLCDSKVAYMRLGRMLSEKGFDVVLPDLRAHGRSTGRFVTYGALEKHDQRRTIDELTAERLIAEPLYVFGASMGGSVAIQYAAMEPRVRGVMAVVPYRDMSSICRRFISRIAPLISDEDFAEVLARAGEIGKFDPAEASALKAISKVRCPVLLVHGTLDLTVPHADSEALLAAANEPKELESIPWANHISVLFGREAGIVKGIEKLTSGRVGTTTRPAE